MGEIGDKVLIVIVGAALGALIQQYRSAVSEELNLINDHIKDFEKFCDLSVKYWTENFADFQSNEALAARVMAAHYSCFHLFSHMCVFCGQSAEEYKRLSHELNVAATGGNFNSKEHKADPHRAADIVSIHSELVHQLRMARPHVISLKRATLKLINHILTACKAGYHSFMHPNRPWLN
ncbi:hypothetical protein OIV19_11885 [Brucella sp. HL-2]|nr:hypothetical protein [Brucella sp. HL-2]MCV9908312.1 hypothetical protein [Brucella sp. HL-2]